MLLKTTLKTTVDGAVSLLIEYLFSPALSNQFVIQCNLSMNKKKPAQFPKCQVVTPARAVRIRETVALKCYGNGETFAGNVKEGGRESEERRREQ